MIGRTILEVFLESHRILAQTGNVKSIIPRKVSGKISRIVVWNGTKPLGALFPIPKADKLDRLLTIHYE